MGEGVVPQRATSPAGACFNQALGPFLKGLTAITKKYME